MAAGDALRNIIQAKLAIAMRYPGKGQQATLANGLWLTIKFQDDKIKVYLSRLNVYPSRVELETILKYWPEPVEMIDSPTQQEYGSRLYLFVSIKVKDENIC